MQDGILPDLVPDLPDEVILGSNERLIIHMDSGEFKSDVNCVCNFTLVRLLAKSQTKLSFLDLAGCLTTYLALIRGALPQGPPKVASTPNNKIIMGASCLM